MREAPYGKVDGLCKLSEREFTANIVSHLLENLFYSFIQGNTCGESFEGSIDDMKTQFSARDEPTSLRSQNLS